MYFSALWRQCQCTLLLCGGSVSVLYCFVAAVSCTLLLCGGSVSVLYCFVAAVSCTLLLCGGSVSVLYCFVAAVSVYFTALWRQCQCTLLLWGGSVSVLYYFVAAVSCTLLLCGGSVSVLYCFVAAVSVLGGWGVVATRCCYLVKRLCKCEGGKALFSTSVARRAGANSKHWFTTSRI